MFFAEYGPESHPICARQPFARAFRSRADFLLPSRGGQLRHVCTDPSRSAWTVFRLPIGNRPPMALHPELFGDGEETMEVNGIAHIFLTASNFERSREFYRKLLPFLGMKPVIDSDTTYYCVGGRTAVAISAPAPEHAGSAFEQNRVGLHHLCFRARERADVDELHGLLCSLGVKIIRAPREDQWAPGYYSLLFEDPDGIRLEINHVPGKGLLA
jgi:catechol 2,3-dioxygenase-like lactoylglutathione lyase family enzyme